MNFLKVDMRQMVCFEIKEILDLLLWPVESLLLNSILNARLEDKKFDEDGLKKSAIKFGKDSANSKDYEYWAAIFNLCEEVGIGSEICFYLKNTFDVNHDTINSYANLENFKEDPPDVVIRSNSGNLFEFELKRYRGESTEDSIFNFIEEKILKHYSVAFNFCIILQHKPGTKLPEPIFKNLYDRIKNTSTKRGLGKICVIFNANNQSMVFAHIYPEFLIYKTPFISGSSQVKKMVNS